MALSSKQRAQLKGIAMSIDTIVQIGKGGISENTVTDVSNALRARELIKGKVLENSLLSAREAAEALAEACGADVVQTIGSKFVLYKRNAKEPKIELVKEKKK